VTSREAPHDGAAFRAPHGSGSRPLSRPIGVSAPKMLRGDAITQNLRTTEVHSGGRGVGRNTVPDAQIRGTEDAFPMRRELVLDDSYEISPLASMSLGVGMQ
jgi:hypothetical protein